MAEIIKPGRQQRGNSQEFVCTGAGYGNGGCGATILVSEFDVYVAKVSFYDEDGERQSCDWTTFCCPSCGAESSINIICKLTPAGKRPTVEERRAIASRPKNAAPPSPLGLGDMLA